MVAKRFSSMGRIKVSMAKNDIFEFQEKMAQLPQEIEDRCMEALQESLEEVETTAKNNAPVDSGALRDSIESQVVSNLMGTVGTDLHYAPFVEFGTSKQDAQGFFFAAAEQERVELPRRITRIMKGLE